MPTAHAKWASSITTQSTPQHSFGIQNIQASKDCNILIYCPSMYKKLLFSHPPPRPSSKLLPMCVDQGHWPAPICLPMCWNCSSSLAVFTSQWICCGSCCISLLIWNQKAEFTPQNFFFACSLYQQGGQWGCPWVIMSHCSKTLDHIHNNWIEFPPSRLWENIGDMFAVAVMSLPCTILLWKNLTFFNPSPKPWTALWSLRP